MVPLPSLGSRLAVTKASQICDVVLLQFHKYTKKLYNRNAGDHCLGCSINVADLLVVDPLQTQTPYLFPHPCPCTSTAAIQLPTLTHSARGQRGSPQDSKIHAV